MDSTDQQKEKKEDPGTSDIPKESTGFFPNWLVDQRSYTIPCSAEILTRPDEEFPNLAIRPFIGLA